MRKDAVDSRWLDDFDPEIQPGLTCHLEIDINKGDTYRSVLTAAARTLRATASKIEAAKLDTGFHPVTAADGESVGQVYLDFYETDRS